jgi:hypothetical protein
MAKRKAVQSDMFSNRADDTPLFSKSPMRADSSEFAPSASGARQLRLFANDFEELAKGARAKRAKRAKPADDDIGALPLFDNRDNCDRSSEGE